MARLPEIPAWFYLFVKFAALGVASSGCRSDPAPTTSTPPAAISVSSASQVQPEPRSSELDALFRGYQQRLPSPATLSEGNGASIRCERHRHATYTLLEGTARKLPVKTDADVARLGHWARDADPCVRQIAVQAIVPRIGFDANRLVVPSMHEPDHRLYHQILARFRAHLRDKKIAHDTASFDGLLLDLRKEDFARLLRGEWREDPKMRNFVHVLVVDNDELTHTYARTEPDPQWPDQVTKGRVADVKVDEQGRFALPVKGRSLAVLPVTRDVLWLEYGPTSWAKLRRVGR